MVSAGFPHLILRFDADKKIGLGHLVRSSALAEFWLKKGGDLSIYSRPLIGEGRDILNSLGLTPFVNIIPESCPQFGEITLLTQQAQTLFSKGIPPLFFLDGYQFDEEFQKELNQSWPLAIMDDHRNDFPFFADLILNQNAGAEITMTYPRAKKGSQKLLGLDYLLLRSGFSSKSSIEKFEDGSFLTLVITLGGSHQKENLRKIVSMLSHSAYSKSLSLLVFSGETNPSLDLSQFQNQFESISVLPFTPQPQMIFSKGDIALSASGSSTWEFFALGVPTLLLWLSDNQKGVAEYSAKQGAALNLGRWENLTEKNLILALEKLVNDPSLRKKISKKGRELVDFEGAKRVTDALKKLSASLTF